MGKDRSAPLGGLRSCHTVESILACLRQELYEVDMELQGRDLELMERGDFMAIGIVRALDFHLEKAQAKQKEKLE